MSRLFTFMIPMLAACSGGGGTAATDDALALFGVAPATIVATEDATLDVTCEAAETDGLALETTGGAAFPCAVAADGSVTCTVPAGSLGAGRHDLRLARRSVRSNVVRDALEVVAEDRPIDGVDAGAGDPLAGSANIALLRLAPAAYADGVSVPADGPNPRAVSNAVSAQAESVPDPVWSDFLWQWGQFLDHDIDLSLEADPEEPADIPVPAGDPQFDPDGTGAVVLHLSRSAYVAGSAPREQTNALTAFIDASQVYGSDAARAAALRASDGTGRLATSAGNLLPFNTAGLPNAGGPDPELFLAGDVRANEQVGLLAMHTLFVREHNRLADAIRAAEPGLGGDEVYQRARRIVGALMQVVTYEEFLPALLGPGALGPYRGYDATVDPGIANIFSTAAFRLGHSMLSPTILRLDTNGDETADGHLALRDAFFNPGLLAAEDDVDPILRGLAGQPMQRVDVRVVDDVRNFLFGPPGAGGLDLVALNIQRGREHGLARYNDAREAFGLPPRQSLAEVSSDPGVQASLAAAYATVDELDPWVGGLAEDPLPRALVGELFHAILTDQFRRLRDGDRFWYERVFSGADLVDLRRTRLSDIIRRNTGIGNELPDAVFRNDGRGPVHRKPRPVGERRLARLRAWPGR